MTDKISRGYFGAQHLRHLRIRQVGQIKNAAEVSFMPREIGVLRRSVESASNSETLSKRQKLADPHGGVKFGFLLDGDAVADGNACHSNKRKNGETRHGNDNWNKCNT